MRTSTISAAARRLALAATLSAAAALPVAAQTTPATPPTGSGSTGSGSTGSGSTGSGSGSAGSTGSSAGSAGSAGSRGASGGASGMTGMSGMAGASGMDSTMMAAPVLREPVAEMFTPAKVAGVASVSNMSEILPSRLAVQRSQRADVRAYAQEMIAMHTRLEQQMQAMLKAKGLTAEHNGYSYQVQSNLRPMMQQLTSADARNFDRLYMSHQVSSHMNTLNALDTTLLPNARDPEMQAMLRDVVRPAVADHYVRAIALRDAVAGNQGGGQRGAGQRGASGSR